MSIAASAAQATSSAATVVPDVQRSNFLPRLFGQRHFLAGEAQIFDTMRLLSPADYHGGFWEFYEHAGEPLYLAPKSQNLFRISWHGNGYEGEVSADAVGIIATLFALSDLAITHQDPLLGDAFHRLYEFARGHAEAAEIGGAIG